MKKFTIVLLTLMMWFNTLTVNVFAESEGTTNENTIENSANEIAGAPDNGDILADEEEIIVEEQVIENEDIDTGLLKETSSVFNETPKEEPAIKDAMPEGWSFTPIENLKYTGKSQALANYETPNGGFGYTYGYQFTINGKTANNLNQTNAGTYEITYQGRRISLSSSDVDNTRGTAVVTIDPVELGSVVLSQIGYKYDGKNKSASYKVLTTDGNELSGGFTKTGDIGSKKSVGNYSITITPDGNNVTGDPITVNWYILNDAKDLKAASIKINKSFTYNEEEQELKQSDLQIKVDGKTLTTDDYEIISGNKQTNAGTYSVGIKAKEGSENCSGETSFSWTINKASAPAPNISKLFYNGNDQQLITLATDEQVGYEFYLSSIDYSDVGDIASGLAMLSFDWSSNIANIKGKDSKTYNVYWRTVNETTNYKKAEQNKKQLVKPEIEKATISSSNISLKDHEGYSYDYSGSEITVTPVVKIGDTVIPATEYEIDNTSVLSTKDAGEHHIYLSGKNNINTNNPKIDVVWEIAKVYDLSIAANVLLTKTEFDYTGDPINVIENNGFEIKAYGETLTQGEDYEIETNSNIGEAISDDYILVINGLGDWAGSSITIPWKITKVSPIVNAKNNLTYNGNGQELVSIGAISEGLVYSFYVSDSKVDQNTLNNATFDSNIPSRTNAGTYFVYWQASGSDQYKEVPKSIDNYKQVSIAKANVNNINIKVKGDIDSTNQYIYINENISPVFVGDYGQLGPNDYTLSSESSKKSIGTYSVKVTGKGNYTGDITLEWKIVGNNDLSHATVDFKPANAYYYNGQNQTVKAEDFVIKYDTTTLTPNVDFEIIDGANGSTGKNASSSYLVTISGTGNYINSIQGTWAINKVDPDVYFVNETSKEKSGELYYTGEEQTLVKNSTSESVEYSYYISTNKYNDDGSFWLFVDKIAGNAWTSDFNDVTKKEAGTYYVYWKATGNVNYNKVDANRKNVVEVTIKSVPSNPNIEFISNPNKSTAKFTFKDNKYGLVIDPNNGYVVDKLTLVEGENNPRTIELVRDEDGNYITSEYIKLNTEIKNTFTAELREETDADKAIKVELLTSGLTGTALKQKLNYFYSGRTFRIKAKDADISTAYEINSGNAANTIDIDGSDFEFVDGVVYQYQYSTRKDSVNYNNTWFDFMVNHYFATETEVVNGEKNDVSFKQRISGTTTQEITDKLYTQYDTEITINDIPYMEYVVKVGDGDSTTTLTSDNNVFVIKGDSDYKDSKYVELPDVSKLSVIYSFNNKIVLNNGEHGKLTYNIGRVDSSISFTATPDDFYEVGKFTLTVHDNSEGTDDVYYLTSEDYSEELNGVYSTNDLQTLIDLDADNTYTITAEYSIKTIKSIDNKNIFVVPVLYKNNVATLWKTVFTDVFKISLINNTGIEIESIDGDKYDINPHISLANLGLINITEGTVYRYRTYKQITNNSKKEDYSYWTYFAVHYYTRLIPVIQEQGVLDLSKKYSNYVDYAQIDTKGNEIAIVDDKILSEYDTIVKVKDVTYMRPVVTFSNISVTNSPATRSAKNDNVTTYVISKGNYNGSNMLSSIEDATLTVTVNFVESFDSFLDIKDNDYGTIVPTKDNDNIIFTVTPAVGYKVTGLTYKEIEKPATLSDLLDKEDSEKVEESIASTSELEQLKEVVEEEVEDVTPVSIELTFNEGNGVAKSKGTKFYENKYYVIEATIEPELILVDNPVAKAYKDYEGNMHVPTEEELFSAMVDTENCDTEQSKVEIKYFCLTSDNYATNSEDLFAWQDLNFKKSTITSISELFGRTYHEFGEGYKDDEDGNAVEMIRFYINGTVNKELSTKAFYKEITLKDTRIPVVISSNSSSFSYTYTRGLKEALSNEIYERIIVKNSNNLEDIITEGISIDDFDIQGIPENASILSRKVTVVFKGNSEFKPTENNVLTFNVRVNRAASNLDVHANNKGYDGKQIELSISATPAEVAKAYIISGIDANLEGFVSVQIDTDKMVYEVPDTSSEIENLIRQILENDNLTIPDSIRTLLDAYIRIDDVADSGISDIIAWINERAGRELIPTSTTTKQKIIEQLVNTLLPDSLKGIYKDGKIYYGDAIVNLINVAITTRDTVQLSAYINELNSFLTKLNVNNDQLTNLLENVEKAIKSIEDANTTKIYLNKGVTPTNAGIYSIFGSTIDRNYIPELTIDTFTIEAIFNGSIEWNQTLGNKLIGDVYRLTVRSLDDKTPEELKEIFGAKYNVPDGYLGENTQEHIDETTPKYLYFGSEVTTEEEIKNIINEIQNIKSLEDINNIIKKYNNIYVGNNINEIDLDEGGIYTEVAYVYGNYIEAAARIFAIERIDTKIELDDIKVIYSGKESTYNAISEILNSDTNNIVIDKDTNNAIKDAEDKLVRPELYFVGLQADGRFIVPTKEIPTNAGSYLMFARFAGTKFYKGSNIFEDEAKDIIEVMQTINADNFTEKVRELGLPILTIERKDVFISWNNYAKSVGNVDLLNVLHYTYNGEALDKYYDIEGLIEGDAVTLNVIGNDNNAGYHTMLFTLSGDSALNYDINTSILSTSSLTYEIEKRKLIATWNDEKATEINGTIKNGILEYEYSHQKPTTDYIVLDNIVDGDVVLPRIISGSTDDACQTILNHELLIGLTGKDAGNYYLTDLLVLDLDYKALPYRINPRPIKISWNGPDEGDDYTIEADNVLTYIYNGKINYLTDYQGNNKFKVEYAGELENPTNSAFIAGDDASVDISNGLEIHVGKYNAEFSIFGRNDAKNYKIIEGSKLPYEITPKHIEVSYVDSLRNVDEAGIAHYIYNGERQYPTNSLLKLIGTLDNDQVYPVIRLNLDNIYTVYNSIDASDVVRSLDITLIGSSARDYVLDDATVEYYINQRPVYVKWIKTAFDYDGNEKSPLYEISNIVRSDRRNTSVELIYSNYGSFKKYEDAPSEIGTYVAYVTGINNGNYKLISPFLYDSRTIFNICDTDTVHGNRISIGSVTSEQLQEKGVTAQFSNVPKMSQGIDLLKNLRDRHLLTNFMDLRMNRLLHLNLESDYVDIYSEGYEKKLEIVKEKLDESIVKKAFFFDIDLYADVTGVIDKARVHETNSDYQVDVTLTFDRDSDVVKNIVGKNKKYYVIRIHNGELKFLDVKVTADDNNYYFTFKSDKFSTYGLYSKDIPQPGYVVPKTGVR